MPARIDLTGMKFGRLTAIRSIPHIFNGHSAWDCTCDCGTTLLVRSQLLRKGITKSCGCLRTDTTRARLFIDGRTQTRMYQVWNSIRGRCRDKNHSSYSRYGGRGITICDHWLNYENFLADMGERPSPAHSIDRINNDGPYSPGNCRWATRTEQVLNRRTTRFLTYKGRTQPHATWERELGLPAKTINSRMKCFGKDAPAEVLLQTDRFPGRRGRGRKFSSGPIQLPLMEPEHPSRTQRFGI